jgi:hypothetical protein
MALEIPAEFEPLFNLYNIPWPDVDEDVFRALPQPLRGFGNDLTAVGNAIDSALQDLAAGNPSQTLQAIQTYFQAIRRDFLDRVNDLCDDLAGAPCAAAYDMVVGAKGAAIAAVAYEVGNDIVDIASAVFTVGTDSALAAAEAVAVKDAISESLSIAEADIVGRVLSMANGYLDDFVNSVVQPFINSVSRGVESSVESYEPNLVLRQVAGLEQSALLAEDAAAGRLHLSGSGLEACIESIWSSSGNLGAAAQTLEGMVDELFSHPAPNVPHIESLSSEMRMALRGVALTIRNDLVAAVEQLISHVEQHFVNLLQDYKQALDELDEQGRMLATRQHAASGSNVVALSVMGVGATVAGGAAVASGVVNAEEAETVQVGAAPAVDGAASIAVRTDATAVATEAVSAQLSVDDVALPSPPPTVTVAPTTSRQDTVESLKAKVVAEGPHLALAHDGPAPTATVAAPRTGEHLPAHDTATTSPPTSEPDLHVGRPESDRPKVGRAESSVQGEREVRADRAVEKAPNVDETAATEARDQ